MTNVIRKSDRECGLDMLRAWRGYGWSDAKIRETAKQWHKEGVINGAEYRVIVVAIATP